MNWINTSLQRASESIYLQAIYLTVILFVVAVTALIVIFNRIAKRKETQENNALIDAYLKEIENNNVDLFY